METLMKARNSSGNPIVLRATESGMLKFLPYAIAWTAKGYGKQVIATSAVASLITRPSTLSAITLLNNESAGGKHLVIERAFAHVLVTDAEENASIWLCSHPVGTELPSGNEISIRNSTSGKAAGGSLTIVDTAEAVPDGGWYPWGNHIYTNKDGTIPAGHIEAQVAGAIIVPPKGAISIHVVSSSTGNTVCCGFHWFEVPEGELLVV